MLFILLTLLCVFLSSEIDAIGFQFTFINPDHSTVKLRPSLWKSEVSAGFEFHLKVNRENGTVLTVLNKKEDGFQVKIVSGHFIISHHALQTSPTMHSPVLADTWNTIKFKRDEKKNNLLLFINSNRRQLNASSFAQWKEVWIGAHEEKASTRYVTVV